MRSATVPRVTRLNWKSNAGWNVPRQRNPLEKSWIEPHRSLRTCSPLASRRELSRRSRFSNPGGSEVTFGVVSPGARIVSAPGGRAVVSRRAESGGGRLVVSCTTIPATALALVTALVVSRAQTADGATLRTMKKPARRTRTKWRDEGTSVGERGGTDAGARLTPRRTLNSPSGRVEYSGCPTPFYDRG